ncbi:uncharacterized protein EI90DRAFT_2296867 [Cantharellus anzutake]|uniref:uncharacterized protein n=1 Tax=Cantharellus anzutake TaxID=1750568 RepID=UPI0019075892|nr:uncharacterized protein EI90DRAFT_2296867 [Cantharellus anzutake]KAF8339875.1 hypothetical protein EI90DRAFT_2296867 [Cantharellus anzutake]
MANPPSEPSPTQVNVASEADKDIFLACLKEFKELGQKLDRIITSDLTLASAGPVSDVHAPYSSPRNEDEQFEAFQRGMKNLSGAVQSIADGVKELKSAYRLVRVSEALRSRLTLVFYTLGAIAFPSSNAKLKTQWPSQPSQHWTPAQIIDEGVLPLDEAITSDAGTISERLQKLGQCVDVFNAALKGLPGFHDVPGYSASGIDTSLRNFAQDLKYWGRNLNNFQGEITDALGIFIRLGLPIVLHSERDPTFQNLSTVATLFASVSASTIQLRQVV